MMINLSGQGLIFDAEEYEKVQPLERTRADQITDKVSLKIYTPYTFKQYGNTCVAYSLATARTIIYAMQNGLVEKDKISSNLLSPHWIYYQTKDMNWEGCSSGVNPEKAIKLAMEDGMARMMHVEHPDFYPFTGNRLCDYYPPSFNEDAKDAGKWKIDEFYKLKTPEEIKIALTRGDPIMVGMWISNSFRDSYGADIWQPESNEEVERSMGHAMIIVGYDESINGGSFEVLNSWGSEWGDNGYIWINEKDLMEYQIGFWALHCELKFGAAPRSHSQSDAIDSIRLNISIPESIKNDSLDSVFIRLGKIIEEIKN
jgi:hypothetical protein